MLKFITEKKEIIVLVLLTALFLTVSILSLFAIRELRGDAKVIGYVGLLRGDTQTLIIEEIKGNADDEQVEEIDDIITELVTGEGKIGLSPMNNKRYHIDIVETQKQWNKIKSEIENVRNGADKERLYTLSESFSKQVKSTAISAEVAYEQHVDTAAFALIAILAFFLITIVVSAMYVARQSFFKKQAVVLGELAFRDPLTKLSNRAGLEYYMSELAEDNMDEDIGLILFDMGNVKLVNDFIGYSGGDAIITKFSKILKDSIKKNDFVSRYSGDDFVVVVRNANDVDVANMLAKIDESVDTYNKLASNEIEKINYASGYAISNMGDDSLDSLVNKADRKLFVKKRKLKLED